MKKLFNSRFLFILASSLVVLIILTVGAFYLFDDEDDVFISSGYVLNPLSSTSEKYFFEENVGYKENLSSMIEFVDVDENTVTILKDSFLHYSDESLSFMKKGAILDLDTVKGNKVVSFYNITKESVIKKQDNGYLIESATGDINLKNFIGRISDDKYIVVGNLSLKLSGNDKTIDGDYFEIVYIEEGIINIENKNVKYQVAADGTVIYVGDKTIDLGDKKISLDDKDIMSITAITIDGDENIEIIPKGNKEDEEEPDDDSDNGGGDNNPQLPDENPNPVPDEPTENPNEGNTGGENVGEITQDIVITLKNAKTGSTDIDVVFDVVNAKEDDLFKLQVVNLSSGRTVDIVAEVLTDVPIEVNLLTPNTKYLFTVINEKDGGKYFQKVLETTNFGINLEKSYATSDSLVYKLTIDEGTDITKARISLQKFNEETMQYEVVTTSYTDPDTKEVFTERQEEYLSIEKDKLIGEHEFLYDNLDSNTIYTVVIDEFFIGNSNFNDIYEIALTSMTLKEIPKFSEMTIEKNVDVATFDLSLGKITDPDNAIVSYTYFIYDRLYNKMAIEPIVQNNASPITVKVGNGENQLKNDTNYYYQVIIEYFDNEKYIEYVTSDSIVFMMGNDPYVEVIPNEDKITHDTLVATVKLKDTSCLISQPGRENCGGESTTVVEVSEVNQLTGEKKPVFTELVTFNVDGDNITYPLEVSGLTPGAIYNVEVRASYNNTSDLEQVVLLHTDESVQNIKIKALASFKMNWRNSQGNTVNVVNASVQFKDNETHGALSSLESLSMIEEVVIKFYEGQYAGNIDKLKQLDMITLYKANGLDIKKLFYDDAYKIYSNDTFGWTMEDLIKSYGDKLSEYYTISIDAYTGTGYKIDLVNNIYPYKVSSSLFANEITKPVMEYKAISKSDSEYKFENLNKGGTVVGYKIKTSFDNSEFEANRADVQKINYYVYDKNREKVKFYIMDSDGKLKLVDKYTVDLNNDNSSEEGAEETVSYVLKYTDIYLDYGLGYESIDNIMRRGNGYYIGYDLEILFEGQTELEKFPEADPELSPTDYGIYAFVEPYKEAPDIDMYVSTSDKNSITYKYLIKDPDNVIYKKSTDDNYSMYYYKNDGASVKYNLVKNEDATYNEFDGKIEISGLVAGDTYGIYFEANMFRTDTEASNIERYFDGHGPIVRMFDGYYDPNSTTYNLTYTIINDQSRDNRVAIEINASEKILNRVLSYKLLFTTADGDSFRDEQWKLSVCPDDKDDALARCLYVDYTTLKAANMQGKNISVKVEMLYDNGLTGFDFKVGGNIDDDYQYMIMQQNSGTFGMGSYVVTNNNKDLITWSADTSTNSRGYYQYAYVASDYVIEYTGMHLANTVSSKVEERVNLSANGFTTNKGGYTLNPKMVSVVDMPVKKGTAKTFSFFSITPKVKVDNKASLLNGNYLSFQLSGLDLNDIQKEKDGEYYLYVATWSNSSDAKDHKLENVVRPVVKVKINKNSPLSAVNQIIGGLLDNTTYYHNVYAYMRDDENKFAMTQLYDAGNRKVNKVKIYEYKTLVNSGIFDYGNEKSLLLSYSIPDLDDELNPEINLLPENYSNRNLDLTVNLKKYNSNVAYNFGLVYVLCEKDASVCDEKNNIFNKEIPKSEMATLQKVITDSVALNEVLPDGYNLEYGKHYTMYLFAKFDDYYKTPTDTTTRYLKLNQLRNDVMLEPLEEPTFVVTRAASIDTDGRYFIDFDITLSDPDRTLVNGQYFVSLKKDGEQKGIMQLKDIDGVYTTYGGEDYGKYAFSGYNTNQSVRITGLEADTKYTIEVTGTINLNNADIAIDDRIYTLTKSNTVYTTNDLGVAFGHDITFSATEKSIIVTFLGGSNFDNVKQVRYSVGAWEGAEGEVSHSGTYNLETDNKGFDRYSSSADRSFTIDPPGMTNVLGKTYLVSVRFCVGLNANECVWFPDENASLEIISRFEGKAIYVKDE